MDSERLDSSENSFLGVCFAYYRSALLGAELVYSDGASQRFGAEGSAVYTHGSSRTMGTWQLTYGGKLTLFWPGKHRKSFDIGWAREGMAVVGLSLTDRESGETTVGRFRFADDRPGPDQPT